MKSLLILLVVLLGHGEYPMAPPTNTYVTKDMVAIHEDLSDDVKMVDPTETPIFTALERGEDLDNVAFDWKRNSLNAPRDQAPVEGDEFSAQSVTKGQRLQNLIQETRRDLSVSFIAQAVNQAGTEDAFDEEVMKATLECKRDMEFILTRRRLGEGPDSSGAHGSMTHPIAVWIRDGANMGAGGSPAKPTLSSANPAQPATAGTPGTTDRAIDIETLFKEVNDAYTRGGMAPFLVVMTQNLKMKVAGFLLDQKPYIATPEQMVTPTREMMLAADVMYIQTPGGIIQLQGSRQYAADNKGKSDVFILDTNCWEIRYLIPMSSYIQGLEGTANRTVVTGVWGLQSSEQKASACIASIKESMAVLKKAA